MNNRNRREWKTIKLKEVCREITVGFVGPMADEYTESGITFLRSQNVLPFHLDLSSVKFISPEFHRKLRKSELRPGDVVVIRTGYPGIASVIPSTLQVANCADLVIIKTLPPLDPYFLTYIFNSTWGRSTVAGRLVGVAQQHFNISAAKEMVINLPSPPLQHTIVSILSAYDDLIENNTRRIAILEEMAQMLYDEWFVKFRFPGYEEAGVMPEEWEVVSFFDIAEILSGGTPQTTEPTYWNGNIPFYTPKDAPNSFFVTTTEKSITKTGLKACSSRLYPPNTVFITARGTVGRVSLNAVDMAMNQSCYALKSREEISQIFIFLHIKNSIKHLQQTANGAVFDTIIVDTFKWLQVVKPSLAVIDAFTAKVTPTFDQILSLTYKNANLRRTRDLLLPKLISGEIDVSSWSPANGEEVAQELASVYAQPAPQGRRVAETEPIEPIDVGGLERRSLWET